MINHIVMPLKDVEFFKLLTCVMLKFRQVAIATVVHQDGLVLLLRIHILLSLRRQTNRINLRLKIGFCLVRHRKGAVVARFKVKLEMVLVI